MQLPRTLEIGSQQVPVIFERRNVRCLRLRVVPNGSLQVIAPAEMPIAEIARFIHEKKDWIEKSLGDFAANPRKQAPTIAQGARIMFLGIERELQIFENQPKAKLEITGDCFFLHLRNGTKDYRSTFKEKYRALAAKLLSRRIWELAHQFGLEYNQLAIKDQRTRWGSCSHQKNINLNWRLVLAPPAVMDYVILHELTHLDELNHTKRFWDLVKIRDPEYKKHRQWLSEHAPKLEL